MPPSSAQPTHIPVLDHLRGLAAAAVCLFHFTNGLPGFLPSHDPVKQVGAFGWLGVEAFFVISGFVIPYSLHLRSYRLRDAGGFFVRRLKRLEPPYLACILLVIALNYASSLAPGFRGEAFKLNWPQLLAHIGYLNAVLGYAWLNPVFWTLAIEFQYYVFMALAFPLIAHRRPIIRTACVLAIALLGFAGFDNTALLPLWLPLFAMGIATFQSYVGKASVASYLALLALSSTATFFVLGLQPTVVGIATALSIRGIAWRQPPRALFPLAFLGTISYSLYLLHVPIGGRVINLASRLPDSVAVRYPAIVGAFAVSIASAAVFWWLIERTSQRWAQIGSILPWTRRRSAPVILGQESP